MLLFRAYSKSQSVTGGTLRCAHFHAINIREQPVCGHAIFGLPDQARNGSSTRHPYEKRFRIIRHVPALARIEDANPPTYSWLLSAGCGHHSKLLHHSESVHQNPAVGHLPAG